MEARLTMHRDSYVADTVALARYLEDSLPSGAGAIFEEAESGRAVILIPEIVIGEFVYVALKGRLKTRDPKASILEMLQEINASAYLRPVSMTPESWERFLESDVKELHDRMIHSIAVANSVSGILTSDQELSSTGFPTIW